MSAPISITMAGGLGNQLFQFAAGTFIEEKLSRTVVYDISNLKHQIKSEIGNYTRSFELQDLIPKEKIVLKRFNPDYDLSKLFLQWQKMTGKVLIENGPNDKVLEKISTKTNRLNGYFQNSNIVEEVWPKIRETLAQSQNFKSLVNCEKSNQIAIHLRFGDYKDDPKTKAFHGLTKPSFYFDAINHMRKNNDKLTTVKVVTDNVEQAKINLINISTDLNFEFLSNESSITDLSEMAKSSHVAISNSTFAWWGAWFAFKGCGAEVIYPRPWFADYSDVDIPIYVEGWKSKKRDFEI